MSEQTLHFSNLPAEVQKIVIGVHAKAFIEAGKKNIDTRALAKIFSIGNPKIVIGKDYCRVHADSRDIMKLLTKNYIK